MHKEPLAPPASTVPIMRKHHLEPIVGEDEWSGVVSRSSSGVFSSAKDGSGSPMSNSGSGGGGSGGKHYNRDHLYSLDSAGTNGSGTGTGGHSRTSSRDVRDDERYISSESSSNENHHNDNTTMMETTAGGETIEKLTRDFCRRYSPPSEEEQRDKQASSSEDLEADALLKKEHKKKSSSKRNKKKKHKKSKETNEEQEEEEEDDIEDGKYKTKKGSKSREDKEGVEMKTKQSRRKSKDRSSKKRTSKEDEFLKRYLKELEYDRDILMAEWKKEFKQAQKDDSYRYGDDDDYVGKGSASGSCDFFCKMCVDPCIHSIMRFLSFAEVFFGNMPITVAAVGLSWVTQGTIWFKFMEENIDACTTVRFNSDRCSFGEFPGCFECDTSNPIYLLALTFHYFCHSVAFTCCLLFIIKIFVAGRVVVDELRNPATSSPMGIVCITLECIFAGIFGKVGESIVIGVSIFHVLLSFWFCYMAIFKFRLQPDPSWYPNCIGLAYAAVKSWLYFPWVGKAFMALCMFYFFTMFFIGTIRVATNHKIAAPVCFIGLSAPSITMYAMTIMAQPSRPREIVIESDPALMHHFEVVHHDLYIPVMHGMMFFSLMGMASALHSLWQRWPTFKHKPFAPAHFAFIFPILSHTNAVQAYRSGVDSFAGIPIGTPFKLALWNYWFICLISGTLANFIFSWMYLRRLPKWTKIDISEEDEQPPSPSHTVVHDCLYESDAHETILSQNFVSPAVLQANETGQLVRLRRGTDEFDKYGPYVRTRKVVAFGFDLPMTDEELRQERAELLHWVAVNAPRTRNRTMSHNAAFQSLLPSINNNNNHQEAGDSQQQYGSTTTNNIDNGAATGGTTRHSRSYTHHF